MPFFTTLARIREHEPCTSGWRGLLTGLGKTKEDDEPLMYSEILRINGLDDAAWCARAEPQYNKEWRTYAIWCAKYSLRKSGRTLTKDEQRLLSLLHRYMNGAASYEDIYNARHILTATSVRIGRCAALSAAGAALMNVPGEIGPTSKPYKKFLEIVGAPSNV